MLWAGNTYIIADWRANGLAARIEQCYGRANTPRIGAQEVIAAHVCFELLGDLTN
jgi:hypothetical protein